MNTDPLPRDDVDDAAFRETCDVWRRRAVLRWHDPDRVIRQRRQDAAAAAPAPRRRDRT